MKNRSITLVSSKIRKKTFNLLRKMNYLDEIEELEERYSYGECGYFALALHTYFNLKIGQFSEQGSDKTYHFIAFDEENPEYFYDIMGENSFEVWMKENNDVKHPLIFKALTMDEFYIILNQNGIDREKADKKAYKIYREIITVKLKERFQSLINV